MNRNDVIDVLSVVAAATRRTIGEADVEIWQGVIGDDDKQLALKAVRDHLRDQPGVWLEPGHVHQRVRAMVRDQLEREPREVQAARMEALEAKAREDFEELAERKGIPDPPPKYKRRGVSPYLRVRCPWCKASPGQPCVVPNTSKQPAGLWHPSRKELAEAEVSK